MERGEIITGFVDDNSNTTTQREKEMIATRIKINTHGGPEGWSYEEWKKKKRQTKREGVAKGGGASMWGSPTMELLESLSVPWCRDTRDIIEVLVGARIT
jgi:hypothetical protein